MSNYRDYNVEGGSVVNSNTTDYIEAVKRRRRGNVTMLALLDRIEVLEAKNVELERIINIIMNKGDENGDQ